MNTYQRDGIHIYILIQKLEITVHMAGLQGTKEHIDLSAPLINLVAWIVISIGVMTVL